MQDTREEGLLAPVCEMALLPGKYVVGCGLAIKKTIVFPGGMKILPIAGQGFDIEINPRLAVGDFKLLIVLSASPCASASSTVLAHQSGYSLFCG